jgi:hypothetical protein
MLRERIAGSASAEIEAGANLHRLRLGRNMAESCG